MAATYDLDVSLALDDFGWHFGNNHKKEFALETALGLDELGATELASLFREAFLHALRFWNELGRKDWNKWYNNSELVQILLPLNTKAWSILEQKENGIEWYWINYARKYPENLRFK